MAKPDLSEAPDVPVFRLDDVHRLQADLLQQAERVFGPRGHPYTIAPAYFVASHEACAARIGNEITIRLGQHAARDWQSCVAILGHELVHAHDGLTGRTSWLEEGVGCLFGIGQSCAMFGEVPMHLCNGAYRSAVNLAASVPDLFNVVKALRAQGARMCSVTLQQLMAAAPTVDARKAAVLCAPFCPEVVGYARLHDHDG